MTERKVEPDVQDLSQRAHRLVIGALGFAMPFLLFLIAGFRPTDGLPPWTGLGSISAYYYTGAVGVFVGVLFALSLFLFTYPGYKGVWVDNVVGWVGGTAAMLVALCPTGAPYGLPAPSWWSALTGAVHFVSAVTLFVAFILFSIWLFRKSKVEEGRPRPPPKKLRDAICLVCGIVMIICVVWAGIAAVMEKAIFWPETIAIEAFAISWLTKGEVHRLPGEVAKRLRAGS